MTKAIALLSGGLDSILATRLILEQGIAVEALNFMTVFCNCTTKGKSCSAGVAAAHTLGIKLKVMEVSTEYFSVIKSPRYGYGRNLNPCLDCRIFMFKKAAQYMRESGASFIVTGEVLGERPMSQRRDAMRIIERDSGLEGMIVRPLCAHLMEPTIAETQGLVDRKKLLSISGRSRKPQIALAEEFNIRDYPCPAGGCLLTDVGFAGRMRDLMKHTPDFALRDAQLLKCGRHFRLSPQAKLIVGRNEQENNRLHTLARDADIIFQTATVAGPVALGQGRFDREKIILSSRIIARYSDARTEEAVRVSYIVKGDHSAGHIDAPVASEDELLPLRI